MRPSDGGIGAATFTLHPVHLPLMKRELMAILACPQCKDELKLDATEEDTATGEVLQGTLMCVTCGRAFKIIEGIPDLRPPEDI